MINLLYYNKQNGKNYFNLKIYIDNKCLKCQVCIGQTYLNVYHLTRLSVFKSKNEIN